MFGNNVFFVLALRSMLIVSIVLSVFSFSPFAPREARAADLAPIFLIGEAIADSRADAFIIAPTGERLEMNSFPMPILKESRIRTGDGVAVITLSPDGLVEVLTDSEIMIDRFEEKNLLSILRGAIRFTVPSNDVLSVDIPSAALVITLLTPMVSALNSLPYKGSERSGIVELMDDGRVLVSSSKGIFKVSALNGNSMIVEEGKTFMLARAGGGGSRASGTKVARVVSRANNLLLIGSSVAVAAGVILISGANDSGGGWVASSP